MAGNNGIANTRQFAIHHMQIGPAHTTGADFNAHRASAGYWIVPLLKPKRRAGRHQNHGMHRTFLLATVTGNVSAARDGDLIRVKETAMRLF
jgi:hypothetical protein